jgi:putative ATPase
MKNLGYGKGYKYAHQFEDAIVYQQNLPESLEGKHYYKPTDRGFEREAAARIQELRTYFAEMAARERKEPSD